MKLDQTRHACFADGTDSGFRLREVITDSGSFKSVWHVDTPERQVVVNSALVPDNALIRAYAGGVGNA